MVIYYIFYLFSRKEHIWEAKYANAKTDAKTVSA
jgi:hypothetical protein